MPLPAAARPTGECWHQTTLVAGISVTGAVVTIARAVQSEAFETALLAFAMVE